MRFPGGLRPRAHRRARVALSPIGLYQPGDSPIHRMGAGPKLLVLAFIGIGVSLASNLWATALALLLALTAIRIASLPLWSTLTRLRLVVIFALGLVIYHAWASTWHRGLELSTNLVALVLLAVVFTATTQADDLISLVVRGMTHLVRVPLLGRAIKPQSIALSVSIMLRTIPLLTQVHAQTVDAARARGLERLPRAVLVPLVLRAVSHAHDTGQALHARGVLDTD